MAFYVSANVYMQGWLETPFARLSGAVATVLFIVSMGLKSEIMVKQWLAVTNLFSAIHFFIIGAEIAALISLIAVVRLALSSSKSFEATTRVQMSGFFSVLYCLIMMVFYKNPVDYLAFAGTLINTWAAFLLNGIKFRLALLLGTSFWFLYDVSVGAYEIAVTSLLGLLTGLVALVRETKNNNRC